MSTSTTLPTPASLTELVATRRSTRSFNPSKPVPEELLKRILKDANHAPSWCNVQPFHICIATGPKEDRITKKLTAFYDKSTQTAGPKPTLFSKFCVWMKGLAPDGDYSTQFPYPPHLNVHRRNTGFALYKHLGIERSDAKGRSDQVRKNFYAFDAPVVMFVFVEDSMVPFSPLDTGFFLQTLLLSAHANGLGSIALGSLAAWGSPIRAEFPDIPKGYKLLCGVAIGYKSDEVESAAGGAGEFNPGRREMPPCSYDWSSTENEDGDEKEKEKKDGGVEGGDAAAV